MKPFFSAPALNNFTGICPSACGSKQISRAHFPLGGSVAGTNSVYFTAVSSSQRRPGQISPALNFCSPGGVVFCELQADSAEISIARREIRLIFSALPTGK